MRAIVIRKSGGPEVLIEEEVPTPEPSRGEVRVRVRAAGVNRADLLQRLGHYPAPHGAPTDIPGLEYAGDVDAVGADVTGVAIGERVFGIVGGGAYAEQLLVHPRAIARIPARLGYSEAAAIPEAFLTAYDALIVQAALQPGETVLVHAVGSGVGTAAVQIARAVGARVVGTARSPQKLEGARRLGMDEGILSNGGLFADGVLEKTGGVGVDVVLDLVGGAYLSEELRCIATKGRILLVGLVNGRACPIDLGSVLQKRVQIRGTVLRSRPLEERIVLHQQLSANLGPLFERGVLRPVLDRVFPLLRSADAHIRVAANENFGKVVLEVD